jgi:hypothetical protein
VLFSSTPSDGSKFWTIPSGITHASDYKIVITSVIDANIYDTSDSEFAIFGESQSLPFNDDFTNGPKPDWQIIGNHWNFADDKVYANVDPTYQYEYMIVGDNTWTDYTFEVDLMGTSGTDKAIAFRVQDTGNFYFLHFIGPIQYHHLVLQKYVNGSPGTPYYLYEDPNYPVQNNVNYHVKVEAYGTSIKVYVNGNLEIDISDDTYSSGGVALLGGWNGYAPCYVQFDNVSVYEEQSSGELVAYYPFNSNANDESGNGNDAIVNGASLTSDRFGNLNSAYSFDGTNDYLLVPDDDDLRFGTTDFTIDVWTKCSYIYKKRTLIEKRIGNAEYLIDVRLDGTIRGAIVDAANNNVVIYSTTNIADERWHHIALVRDAGTSDLLKLYIDGVLEVSGNYPTLLDVATIGDITFGIDVTNTRYYDGVMDDIHFYNRALTEEEILELYGGYNGGLVAYYPFNGNSDDESGNGNDGTLFGPVLIEDRFGSPNSAYLFDGTDDYINCGNNQILNVTGSLTMSAWFKLNSLPSELNNDEVIVGKWRFDEDKNSYVLNLDFQSTDKFQLVTSNCPTPEVIYGGEVTKNIWYHYAGVIDQEHELMKIYVNGVLVAEETYSGQSSCSTDENLLIGKINDHGGSNHFHGAIDEVRIYSYALTDEEIFDLYGGFHDGLVASYPFNGNANDESGNGYDGIVSGASLTNDRFENPNSAYIFNGSDYIEVPNGVNFQFDTEMSISLWMYISSTNADVHVIGNWSPGNVPGDGEAAFAIAFLGSPGNEVVAFICADDPFTTNAGSIIPIADIPMNEWFHIVGTRNSINTQIYLNGNKKGDASAGNPNINNPDQILIMGAQSTSLAKPYRGKLDDVLIYDYALSDEEILELYGGFHDGLVAYYPFNGNANDESGTGNHGTGFGASLTEDRFGNSNSAYLFDGTDDYIEIPDDVSLRPEHITLAVWVYPEELDSYDFDCVLGKSRFDNGLGEQYYLFLRENGFQMGLKRNSNCTTGNGWNGSLASISDLTNRWSLLVSTWDGNRYKQYLNGDLLLDINTLNAGSIDDCPGGELKIGRWWSSDLSYFKGKIDDVRIYNRALSDEEVLELYDINTVGNSITVTLPNGGESWAAGTFHQIKWTDEIPDNEYVKIELFKVDIFHSEITASTPADGSKDWNIPSTLTLGSDYKIKITKADDSNVFDFSDANFTISEFEPQIVLTEPNGGEDWYSGHSNLITWIDNIPENVKIELFKGGVFNSVIISSTYSDGSKDWDIPSDLPSASDYRIKITSVNNSNVFGISDANFTITGGLPVELISFEATARLDRVSLSWQTATETNSYGFDVERQINNNDWTYIGFVEGSGNSNSLKQYSFVDANAIGGSKFFYRIKQIDADGMFEYSDVVEVIIQPNQYTLYQNYPNPFNPITTIKFSLPEDVRVKVHIYNTLGELITEVVNKDFEAGYHKVTFGSSNIPSGIYFFRIIAGSFVETKKMILMK